MKKTTLTLLALSTTIAFADTLQCNFQEFGTGIITLYPNKFYYQGPGCSLLEGTSPYFGENSINLRGGACYITIERQTGAIEVNERRGEYKSVYKGTCTKQMNVL